MAKTHNGKGRKKGNDHHVRFYDWELNSDAYRALTPYSRTLLIEFKRRFKGQNNGNIGMSVREAAVCCNCSEKPMRKALKQLQELGFISITLKGAFSVKSKRSTLWELTEYPIKGTPPSTAKKTFLTWHEPEGKSANFNAKCLPQKKSRSTHSRTSVYPEPRKEDKNSNNAVYGVPRVPPDNQNNHIMVYPEYTLYKLPNANEPTKGGANQKAQSPYVGGEGFSFKEKRQMQNSLYQKAENQVVNALGGWEAIGPFENILDTLAQQILDQKLPNNEIRSAAYSMLESLSVNRPIENHICTKENQRMKNNQTISKVKNG